MYDNEQPGSHWDDPEVVRRFAERDPDLRLQAMAHTLAPGRDRVLDLGCAGGRNSVFLAGLGVHVEALDASPAMVEETRRRLGAIIGEAAALERVRHGSMDDLSAWASGRFALVVALGIYQNAHSLEEWHRAVAETARVLQPGGRALVAHFTPAVDLTGEGVRALEGEAHVFTGLVPGVRAVLLDQGDLEEAMAQHGLVPLATSETVVVETERGRRVTVNALLERAV